MIKSTKRLVEENPPPAPSLAHSRKGGEKNLGRVTPDGGRIRVLVRGYSRAVPMGPFKVPRHAREWKLAGIGMCQGKRKKVRAKEERQIQSPLTPAPTAWEGRILLEGGAKVRQVECARAHGMWTYESRQGRNAATAVCSASAVVTLAQFNSEFEVRSAELNRPACVAKCTTCDWPPNESPSIFEVRSAEWRLKPRRLRCKMHSLQCAPNESSSKI
jgi:hypothetical protein